MFGAISRLAPTLALLAGLAAIFLVGAVGPGYKYGFIELGTIFQGLKYGAFAGLGAGAFGIFAILLRLITKQGALLPALVGIALGVAAFAFVDNFRSAAEAVPPIHDITTDTDNPPEFIAVLPMRGDDASPAEYDGDNSVPGNPDQTVREAQLAHYTDLGPMMMDMEPGLVLEAARATAEEMGWQIVDVDAEAGRIEAIDTTAWYGFKDDVVIRVAAQEDGATRVDVRSKSRVGISDIGTNAARIQAFLDALSAHTGG